MFLPILNGYTADDIKVESSICTGEKNIGFYDKSGNRLIYVELVKCELNIENFYKKYGIDYHKKFGQSYETLSEFLK